MPMGIGQPEVSHHTICHAKVSHKISQTNNIQNTSIYTLVCQAPYVQYNFRPSTAFVLFFYCPMAIKSGILVALCAEYVEINYQIFRSRILSEYYICYKFINFVEYFAFKLIFFNWLVVYGVRDNV
jgi:hypothetical protein